MTDLAGPSLDRKARGAFFTPRALTWFLSEWAIRSPEDQVFEPSAGEAEFLVAAVERIRDLSSDPGVVPVVDGVEIDRGSITAGVRRVDDAGGVAQIQHSDFFLVDPRPRYDAVIGNPPYIRYQDFVGENRARSRRAALRAGVCLTGLASSWAAFTAYSTLFLREGGRLALVLPAELLSVNYAAPIRRLLFERFRSVELVLFDKQVFPDAETDALLLLADGYGHGPAGHGVVHQTETAEDLSSLRPGHRWTPHDPAEKWTSGLVPSSAQEPLSSLVARGMFTHLEGWGDTTLGIVTGNNHFFALSPQRVAELGLSRTDTVPLSPPGSAHLRGLRLTENDLVVLGDAGKSTSLFYPSDPLSRAAERYAEVGHRAGVDQAYKCRVRRPWYRVPLVRPADLLLTCMNADTPRLTTNEAGAHHLNSVHGVYLREDVRRLGRELLPLASLNSVTLLHAETVGRAYGGGVLKLEPKEADRWAVPDPSLISERAGALREVMPEVARLLAAGDLLAAVERVDGALLIRPSILDVRQIESVRNARQELAERRRRRSTRHG